MRRLSTFLSLSVVLLACALGATTPHAASIPVGGPNPNWTEMQKFEWYVGRMAQAAQMCGAYTEAGILNRLARMSPYGSIGVAQMRGDDFYGPACVEISADAKGLVVDANKIEEYLEVTYGCRGEECYGQSLSDWQSHACADAVKSHLASRAVEKEQVREVTITNIRHSGATLDFLARVQLKNCQGSLYVDLKESCAVKRDYTRGDCEIDGVEGY
jgi:hypothetical protein